MQIEQMETQETIAALSTAINAVQADKRLSASACRETIQTLEMMKVAYLLVQRNAAKEQRKGRANELRKFLGPDLTSQFTGLLGDIEAGRK